MRITLIGHGYVGTAIAKELTLRNIDFYWEKHDLYKTYSGIIINAAGYTGSPNVDACETHKQDCIDGNILWPLNLELKSEGPIVHISSGCIYNGYKNGGWLETDEPNFTFEKGASFYSGCKAASEQWLLPRLDKSYILRIRMPFGNEDHPRNYLTKIKTYKKLIDVENSLSRIEDVANVAVHFATTLPEPGIYNVCNPGSVTTKEVTEILGIKAEWFTPEEFKKVTVAPRSNCVLNTDKIQSLYPLLSVRDAIKETIGVLTT